MARIFLSHSSRDRTETERMKAWLDEQGFDNTFLDFDKHAGIPPGADWERRLYEEVVAAQAVILIVTPNWLASKWCFAEFTQARALGKAIFPVIEAPTEQTFIASDIEWLDLLEDREGGLERLQAALSDVALMGQGGFKLPADRSPYPGLVAFEEDDAAVYFGRDDDYGLVIEALRSARTHGQPRLFAILGASGSGKSSLLRAGVLPRLKRDPGKWLVLPPVRPARRPTSSVAVMFAGELHAPEEIGDLETALLDDPSMALDALAGRLRATAGLPDASIVVSIDQAEELFGLVETAAVPPFLAVLEALSDPAGPFITLLTLRSEFLGTLQSTQLGFEEISIRPVPTERIRMIVTGPAKVVGLKIDGDLAARIEAHAETEDALPLLAFTLRELYVRYGKDGSLTLDDYARLGDDAAGLTPIENSVRQAAEGVIARENPGPNQLLALRDAFVGEPPLVRVKDDGFVRNRAAWDDLPSASYDLLQAFQDARLVSADEEDGNKIVEVAHEALFRTWPLLRGWLSEEREFLTWRQRLGEVRGLFDDGKRGLLVDRELEIARGWRDDRRTAIGADDLAFIDKSDETDRARKVAEVEAERQRRLRLQGLAVGLAVVALLAAGAAVFAFQQLQVAEDERADGLVQSLTGQVPGQVAAGFGDRAALLARLALHVDEDSDQSADVDAALRSVLSTDLAGTSLPGRSVERFEAVAISPDGGLVAVADSEGVTRLWRIAHPTRDPDLLDAACVPDDPCSIAVLAFDGTGDCLMAASFGTPERDDVSRVWRWVLGPECDVPLPDASAPITVQGLFHPLVITPDGTEIGGKNEEQALATWDTGAPDGPPTLLPSGDSRSFEAMALGAAGYLALDADGHIWEWTSGVDASPTVDDGLLAGGDDQPDRPSLAELQDGSVLITTATGAVDRLAPDRLQLTTHIDERVKSIAFAVNAVDERQRLATIGADGTVRAWDLAPASDRVDRPGPTGFPDYETRSAVTYFGGGHEAVVGLWEGGLERWDLGSGEPSAVDPPPGSVSEVTVVAASEDGKRVAGIWGLESIWYGDDTDPPTALRRVDLRGFDGAATALALSRDGRQLLVGTDAGSVVVCALPSPPTPVDGAAEPPVCEEVRSAPRQSSGALVAAFGSSSDAFAVAMEDGVVAVWGWDDSEGSRELLWMPTLDDDAVATAAGGDSGTPASTGIGALAFSRDDLSLAVGAEGGVVRVWRADGSSMPEQAALPERPTLGAEIASLAFDAAGTKLAAARGVGDVLVWDTEHLADRPKVLPPGGQTMCSDDFACGTAWVAFADETDAQGERVVVGWGDGRVWRWVLPTAEIADLVCDRVSRELEAWEWEQFVGKDAAPMPICPRG